MRFLHFREDAKWDKKNPFQSELDQVICCFKYIKKNGFCFTHFFVNNDRNLYIIIYIYLMIKSKSGSLN